jgi:hypothetical protein
MTAAWQVDASADGILKVSIFLRFGIIQLVCRDEKIAF